MASLAVTCDLRNYSQYEGTVNNCVLCVYVEHRQLRTRYSNNVVNVLNIYEVHLASIGFIGSLWEKLGTISRNENDRSIPAFRGLEYFPKDSFHLFGVARVFSLVPAPASTRLNSFLSLKRRFVVVNVGLCGRCLKLKERLGFITGSLSGLGL